jgi:hypothetical protein
MERRGADVVAVDNVESHNFRYIHSQLDSRVDYRIVDVLGLSPHQLGRFDIVLFLGVLYHLKHPLLALEKVCALTKEMAIIESYVVDDPDLAREGFPYLHFFESDELEGQLDNWFGPSADCLLALCRTAGFARVELAARHGQRAIARCCRSWPRVLESPLLPSPTLFGVQHYRNYGINFNTCADDYLTLWFAAPDRRQLTRDKLYIEVGPYAVPAIWTAAYAEGHWQANAMLPPGLEPGWHSVRLRTDESPFSNSVRIAVDLSLDVERLELGDVCHGVTWEVGKIGSSAGSCVSFYIAGLPDQADVNNLQVWLGTTRLTVEHITPVNTDGVRQVNARLTHDIVLGPHPLKVQFGVHVAPVVTIEAVHGG